MDEESFLCPSRKRPSLQTGANTFDDCPVAATLSLSSSSIVYLHLFMFLFLAVNFLDCVCPFVLSLILQIM